jgi:cardiolipin synthase (CMP-forming)
MRSTAISRSASAGTAGSIADKLLLTACFVCLAVVEVLPAWLAWLVVGRDIVIVAGAVAYHNLIGPLTAQPTLISKFTTCVQIAFVLATLLHLSRFAEWPDALNTALLWTVVAATVASGIDYVVRWSARAVRARRTPAGGNPPQ